MTILTAAVLSLTSHWECEESSVVGSYIEADVVAEMKIVGYYFEDEKLMLQVTTINLFKGRDSKVSHVFYDHPSAFLDYNAGLNWAEELVNKMFIMYLSHENSVYTLDVCDRLTDIESDKADREVDLLKDLKNYRSLDARWVDNAELHESLKARPLTDIDSLLVNSEPTFALKQEYPVVITSLLLNKNGQLVVSTIAKSDRFLVTEFNGLGLQSAQDVQINKLAEYFNRISSKIANWKLSSPVKKIFNTVVMIRWEVLGNGSIVYKVL